MKEIFNKIINITKDYIANNILIIVFVIGVVLNGFLLRYFTINIVNEIQPILGDLVFALIVGSIAYLFKPKHRFNYFLVASILLAAICLMNSMYYSNYISFTSMSVLSATSQLADVGDAVVENIMEPKDFVYFLSVIALVFTYIVNKNKIKNQINKDNKKHALNICVVAIIISGMFISLLTSTDISRLGKLWNRESVVMKFGIYIYQVNDAISTIRAEITPLFGYDNAAKTFREYYDTKEESSDNEYTDIFEGKNIITIHAESIQNWTLFETINGQEITPNLNKLATEGLYFSNFYAQDGVGASSDAEFTLNTGLMPPSTGTVFLNYFDSDYQTIPKQLGDLGYYNFSMHGNKGDFWNRNVAHDSFGYDYFYYHEKDYVIDESIGLGLSDKSFFSQSVPYIQEISNTHQNFYGTVIMLSNHTPFSDINNYHEFDITYTYEEFNEETGLYETKTLPYLEGKKIGSYIKSVNYADEAIGQFINDLDEAGVLDDTVIVIYGDHDAKLSASEYRYYYNYDPATDTTLDKEDEGYVAMDYYEYELNRELPFIIWTKDSANNNLLNQEVTEVMGMYDIMPTLGNMFGFDTDYSVGSDMFSVENNIVVFPTGNWLTNDMYYNVQKDEGMVLNEGLTISEDYITQNTKEAEERLEISNNIIIYDLIRKTNEQEELLDKDGE